MSAHKIEVGALEAVVVVFFYDSVLELTDKAIQLQWLIVILHAYKRICLNLMAIVRLCCVSVRLLTNREIRALRIFSAHGQILHSQVALVLDPSNIPSYDRFNT